MVTDVKLAIRIDVNDDDDDVNDDDDDDNDGGGQLCYCCNGDVDDGKSCQNFVIEWAVWSQLQTTTKRNAIKKIMKRINPVVAVAIQGRL